MPYTQQAHNALRQCPQRYHTPRQKFDTHFQTYLIISSLSQTNVKGNLYTLLLSRMQNCTVTVRTRLA